VRCRRTGLRVDYFERIAQVRSVGLQAHRTLFPLVEIGAHRRILREIRMDAVANEIEVINHYLTYWRAYC
jgi:hypothetical protein